MSYTITGPLRPPTVAYTPGWVGPSRSRGPPYIAFVGVFRGDNPLFIGLKFYIFFCPLPTYHTTYKFNFPHMGYKEIYLPISQIKFLGKIYIMYGFCYY